jgi:hypothetical protein
MLLRAAMTASSARFSASSYCALAASDSCSRPVPPPSAPDAALASAS